MILTDIRKGLPLIILGLIALLSLIRGCGEIIRPSIEEYEVIAEPGIRHIVLLDLKENANRDAVIKEIEKLSAIEQVKDLEFGAFKDLKDIRALSGYEVALSMYIANESDYRIYQDHPIHLGLKVALKDVLNAPPSTYDFQLE